MHQTPDSPAKKQPHKKGKLARAFGRVARKTGKILGKGLLILSFAYAGMFVAFYPGRGDRLTSGERALVTSIYGDQLNADKIRIHKKPWWHPTHLLFSKKGTVLPPFNHIDFFGKKMWADDYSRADARLYGTFVHEAGHVWQNQNRKWNMTKLSYGYTLDEKTTFSDLGNEQQPEAVEDYAKYFLHPSHTESKHFTGTPAEKTVFYERLKKLVEDQFPQARLTRLALEAANIAKPPAPRP